MQRTVISPSSQPQIRREIVVNHGGRSVLGLDKRLLQVALEEPAQFGAQFQVPNRYRRGVAPPPPAALTPANGMPPSRRMRDTVD